jgi:hypothetical protein
MHFSLYPDDRWKVILHTDRPFNNDIPLERKVNNYAKAGLIKVNTVHFDSNQIWAHPVKGVGMLWRLLPIWDVDNDYVFCRDLDSILTPRQVRFVTDFIRSNKVVHGINDNAAHNIPLMGGMCGFLTREFRHMTGVSCFEELIRWSNQRSDQWDSYNQDQMFLMNYVWPRVNASSLIHRPTGPNDRCMLKDCVPGLVLANISEKVLQEGDNFTNYIGAANCINTTYGERPVEYMNEFYETHGNVEKCALIKEAEKD